MEVEIVTSHVSKLDFLGGLGILKKHSDNSSKNDNK